MNQEIDKETIEVKYFSGQSLRKWQEAEDLINITIRKFMEEKPEEFIKILEKFDEEFKDEYEREDTVVR